MKKHKVKKIPSELLMTATARLIEETTEDVKQEDKDIRELLTADGGVNLEDSERLSPKV